MSLHCQRLRLRSPLQPSSVLSPNEFSACLQTLIPSPPPAGITQYGYRLGNLQCQATDRHCLFITLFTQRTPEQILGLKQHLRTLNPSHAFPHFSSDDIPYLTLLSLRDYLPLPSPHVIMWQHVDGMLFTHPPPPVGSMDLWPRNRAKPLELFNLIWEYLDNWRPPPHLPSFCSGTTCHTNNTIHTLTTATIIVTW